MVCVDAYGSRCSGVDQQPCRCGFHLHLSKAQLHSLEIDQWLAELPAFLRISKYLVSCCLGTAQEQCNEKQTNMLRACEYYSIPSTKCDTNAWKAWSTLAAGGCGGNSVRSVDKHERWTWTYAERVRMYVTHFASASVAFPRRSRQKACIILLKLP